jgi:Nitroreductase
MTMYDTIFTRRSARKYDKKPLDEEILKDIKEFIGNTKQLEGQNARFEVVSDKEVKGSAPHYVLAFCKSSDAAYVNVGYVLQNVDLYIQSMGLGSLYLGMKKPEKKAEDFCIMLAFGGSEVPFRKGEGEFDRLPISEISNADNTIIKAARLAPSARNSQPWKFTFNDNKIVIRYFGRGLLKSVMRKRFSMIDLGIVTRHVEVALSNDGKTITSIISRPAGDGFEIEITYN